MGKDNDNGGGVGVVGSALITEMALELMVWDTGRSRCRACGADVSGGDGGGGMTVTDGRRCEGC